MDRQPISEQLDVELHCPYWPETFAQDYLRLGYWGNHTFASMLATQASQRPTHTALVDGELRLSYAELDRRVGLLADGLKNKGLVPGDVVIVQLPNQAAFVELSFALFRAGVIPVFALPAHREHELLQFCRRTEAKAYFHVPRHAGFDYAELADSLQRQVPSLTHLVALEENAPGDALQWLYGTAAYAAAPVVSAVACFQLSGGTTGTPKLIPRRHHEYLYNARASAERCRMDEHSRYLAVLPMAHNFPMSSPGFLGTLCSGGTLVIARQPSPVECFEIIRRESITHTALVPTLALLWMELEHFLKTRIRHTGVALPGHFGP
ncbi:AMP-binding protein, partial [Azorhizophilus paspali]